MAVSKDTLKTVAGLVVIALIIVGAFLYGDAQHQNQVRQDQNAKKQQVSQSAGTSGSASSASSNQAPAKASATPSPKASTAVSSPAAQPSAGTAGRGGITQTPQTGAADGLVPLAALAIVLVAYRSSLPKRAASPLR